jgi:hypothetical protein
VEVIGKDLLAMSLDELAGRAFRTTMAEFDD